MTIIEQIKAEIEKRLKKYATDVTMPLDELGKVVLELKGILSFISNLESEKPVPNDLDFEQELYKHFGQVKDFTLGMRIGQYFYDLGCRRTAEKYDEIEYNRQRAEEHLASVGKTSPNDLKDASEKEYPCDKSWMTDFMLDMNAHCQVAFWKGAKWQKEQMMEEWLKDRDGCFWDGVNEGKKAMKEQMMREAVEGEVCIPNVWVEHKEGKELVVRAEISKELGFKFGDKVRIIIVKED